MIVKKTFYAFTAIFLLYIHKQGICQNLHSGDTWNNSQVKTGMTNSVRPGEKKYVLSYARSLVWMSAPGFTEWSPVYARFLTSGATSWFEKQFLEQTQYHYSSARYSNLTFTTTRNLLPRWDLTYGLSLGYLRFSLNESQEELEEHLVNEVRVITPSVGAQREVIPINDPKPYERIFFSANGLREFQVTTFSIPLDLDYRITSSLSAGWVNEVTFPLHSVMYGENYSGSSLYEESNRFVHNAFMSRIIYQTGLAMTYLIKNHVEFSVSLWSNVNSVTFKSPDRQGDSPRTRTQMTSVRFQLGYCL